MSVVKKNNKADDQTDYANILVVIMKDVENLKNGIKANDWNRNPIESLSFSPLFEKYLFTRYRDTAFMDRRNIFMGIVYKVDFKQEQNFVINYIA